MADKKLSQLTSATVLNAADYILLTQSGQSLKIDIQTFLKNLPTRPILLEAAEGPASGALSTVLLTSKVTPAGAPTNYTLAAGTNGLEKVIVCETFTSGTAVVTVTDGKGFSTLTFSAVGDACSLRNVNGYWYVLGNNSVVVA